MKSKAKGRTNILLGQALDEELDRVVQRLTEEEGLVMARTDLIRSALAIYLKIIPSILNETRIMTLADIEQAMLSRLEKRWSNPGSG